MEPLNKDDVLIREFSDASEYGAWIGKWVYEDKEGNEYTICQDQDGESWTEE